MHSNYIFPSMVHAIKADLLVWRILAFGLDINANIAEMQSLQRCSDSPVRRQAKLLSKLGETVDHK